MKNINALKKFKGNNIVELIERLQSLETTRPHEIFFIEFQVQVKADYGSWVYDHGNLANECRIHDSHNDKAHSDWNWRDEVAKYLSRIDMDFAYEWDEFCVQTRRRRNLYVIDVFLRRKTAR